MAGFDPNNILQNAEQQAKDKADSEIDNLASKVPGGDQIAQQAKDTVNQGIDQAGQAGMQQAQQQAGNIPGVGQQLQGMLDNQGGQSADPNAGGQSSDPNAGNQGS